MTRRESDSNPGADPPAPKRRARASRAETTRAILEAAEELFAVRHPSDVTVMDVAERAGVTHALVHRYVGTAFVGYAVAVLLMTSIKYFQYIIMLFPASVAFVSVVLIVRRGVEDDTHGRAAAAGPRSAP